MPPFMPFVTEEIYHLLATRKDDLCCRLYESKSTPDSIVLHTGSILKETISGLRDVRNKQQLKPKETVKLYIETDNPITYETIQSILSKQINASECSFTRQAIAESFTTVIGKDKFYLVSEQPIDTENQKAGLEKELQHLIGFLASVEKKLNNEKFVQNAKPEIIALEQKKKSDAESKIKVIQDALTLLK
jgi:valyl-tRNA synthetase